MNFPALDLYWPDLEAMLDERARRVITERADPSAMARELIASLPAGQQIDALRMIAVERRRQMLGVDALPEADQRAAGIAAMGQSMAARAHEPTL